MLKVYDNFFSDKQCDQIVNELLKTKDQFRNRYTALSYLGNNFFACLSDHNFIYEPGLEQYKKIQQEPEFTGFWHDYLLEQMSAHVMPAQYTQSFSKPGFQMTTTDILQPGIWHYNSEKIIFPYQEEFSDYTGNLNYFDGIYTMTIMLTDGAFTFDYYPETDSTWATDIMTDLTNTPCAEHTHWEGDKCPDPNCPLVRYETIHYKKGTLLLQDSRFMHRIGPSKYNDQHRITMQGHGVAKNNIMYLHW